MKIFSASNGLNTKIDPARILFDPETGVQDLAVAYNVDHDPTGRVSRRKGYEATAVTSDCHSLFSDGGDCFYVSGTTLYRLNSDYTSTSVATVTDGARVSYVQLMSRTYWMNGFEKGVVENGVNSDWVKGTYYGPDTTRELYDPPIGTMLSYHGGRFYVVQGNVVWYSDPFNLNAFDLARSFFPFQSQIKMFRPLAGGYWASDEKNIYFLSGTNPKEVEKIKRASYPAISHTDCFVNIAKLPEMQTSGIAVIFTTTQGICVGLPTGEFFNLSHKKLDLPAVEKGTAIVLDDKYITTLQ